MVITYTSFMDDFYVSPQNVKSSKICLLTCLVLMLLMLNKWHFFRDSIFGGKFVAFVFVFCCKFVSLVFILVIAFLGNGLLPGEGRFAGWAKLLFQWIEPGLKSNELFVIDDNILNFFKQFLDFLQTLCCLRSSKAAFMQNISMVHGFALPCYVSLM